VIVFFFNSSLKTQNQFLFSCLSFSSFVFRGASTPPFEGHFQFFALSKSFISPISFRPCPFSSPREILSSVKPFLVTFPPYFFFWRRIPCPCFPRFFPSLPSPRRFDASFTHPSSASSLLPLSSSQDLFRNSMLTSA